MTPFVWNASPEIISFGFLHVRWYGLLFAMGFLVGYWIMSWIFTREKFDPAQLDSLLVLVIVGTIVGARLGHCLLYEPDIYLRDPIRILKVWEGGLASHGGGLGVFLALWWWKRKHFKGSYLQLLDYLWIPTSLVGAMIRVGNFFNSEILGMPSDVPWAVVFQRVDSIPRHPAQLYEAIAYFLAFLLVLFGFKKGWHRGRPGLIFGLGFSVMAVERFLIEFLKERQVAFENGLPLDMGQILSIPFFLAGMVLFVRALRMKPIKKEAR